VALLIPGLNEKETRRALEEAGLGIPTTPTPTPRPTRTPTPTPTRPPTRPVPTVSPTIPIDFAREVKTQRRSGEFSQFVIDTALRTAAIGRQRDAEMQSRQSEESALLTPPLALLGEATKIKEESEQTLAEGQAIEAGAHRIKEADQDIVQREQLKDMVSDFSPDQPNDAILQGLLARPDVNPEDAIERARMIEGGQRVRDFGKSIMNLPEEGREGLVRLSAGLQKEGLDIDTFNSVVSQYKRFGFEGLDILSGDATALEVGGKGLDPATIEKVNRVVLSTIPPPVPGEAELRPAPEAFIREGVKGFDPGLAARQEEFQVERDRRTETIKDLVRTHGSVDAVPASEWRAKGIWQTVPEGLDDEWSLFGGIQHVINNPEIIPQYAKDVVEALFEVEQVAITPFTRPVIETGLQALRIPAAERASELIAEFAVPTSAAFGIVSKGPLIARMGKRFLIEGFVNIEQAMAGARVRGETPLSDIEKALIFVGGGIAGSGAPELFRVASPAFRSALTSAPRVRRILTTKFGDAFDDFFKGIDVSGPLIKGPDISEAITVPGAPPRVPVTAAELEIPGRAPPRVDVEVPGRVEPGRPGELELPPGAPARAAAEVAEEAPPAPRLAVSPETRTLAEVPVVSRVDVDTGDDIVYWAGHADRTEEIIQGTRTRGLFTAPDIRGVANTGELDDVIFTFRVKPEAKPISVSGEVIGAPTEPRGPRRRPTTQYNPDDLDLISQTPITDVFDPETLATGRAISRGGRGAEQLSPEAQARFAELEGRPAAEALPSRPQGAAASEATETVEVPLQRAAPAREAVSTAEGRFQNAQARLAAAQAKRVPGIGTKAAKKNKQVVTRAKKAVDKAKKDLDQVTSERARAEPPEGAEELGRLQDEAASALPGGRLHRLQPNQTGSPVDRLKQVLRGAQRLGSEQRAIAQKRLEAAVAKASRQFEAVLTKEGRKPGELTSALYGGLKGKRKLPTIDPPRQFFTADEIVDLETQIANHYGPGQRLSAGNAIDALTKLLDGYDVASGERTLLRNVFGEDFSRSMIKALDSPLKQAGRELFQIVNIQRVFLSGFGPLDFSAWLRQGALGLMAPKEWTRSAVGSVRVWASSLGNREWTVAYARGIVDDALYESAKADGVAVEVAEKISKRGAGVELIEETILTDAEHSFVGRFLLEPEILGLKLPPVIRATADSYSLFLAKLRLDLYKMYRKDILSGTGIAKGLGAGTLEDVTAMGRGISRLTGRGTLGPLEQEARLWNQILYAARLQASRVQAPMQLLHSSPYVRRVAAKHFLGYAGTVMTTLALFDASGLAEVEWDPRSADWGKLKIGPTRIDLTAGFGPMIRLAGRIATNTTIDPLGEARDIGFIETMGRFIRSKMAPFPGLGADLYSGTNFLGERLEGSWESVRTETFNRIVPLAIQSLIEAIQEGGWPSTPLGLSETVGIGSQSYTPISVEVAEELDNDIFQGLINIEDYPELGGRGPRRIGELHPLDRDGFEDRHPEIIEEYEKRSEDALGAIGERVKGRILGELSRELTDQAVADLTTAAEAFRRGGPDAGRQFREAANTVALRTRGGRSAINSLRENFGLREAERPDEPGLKQDMFDYFEIFDKHPTADTDPNAAELLFDELDTFLAQVGPLRNDAIVENLGIDLKKIPEYKELKDDRQVIRESGYFDRKDQAWDIVTAKKPELAQFEDVNAYVASRELELAKRFGAKPAEVLVKRDPIVRGFDQIMVQELRRWQKAHPSINELVIKWGYRDRSVSDIILERKQR